MFWALFYCFIPLCRGLLCWRKYRFPCSIQFGILLSYIWFLVCGVTWRRGRFLYFLSECLVLLMSFWLYLDLFCFNFWQENFLQSGNRGIGLLWICVSFSYLYELGPNTTSCKAYNKFKLHFHHQARGILISFRTNPMLRFCYGKCKRAF